MPGNEDLPEEAVGGTAEEITSAPPELSRHAIDQLRNLKMANTMAPFRDPEALKELEEHGLVEKAPNGTWRLTDKGKAHRVDGFPPTGRID